MRCCFSAPLAALSSLPAPCEIPRSGALLAPALLRAAADAVHDPVRRNRPRHPDTLAAVHLELVTLAEDHAVITWYTGVPGTGDGLGHMLPTLTEGEVLYGTHPARLIQSAAQDRPTAHHHVELTDLEPGQTYYYRALSRGVAATPTPLHLVRGNAVGTNLHGLGSSGGPYSFTTPPPPPGRQRLLAHHAGRTPIPTTGHPKSARIGTRAHSAARLPARGRPAGCATTERAAPPDHCR
ncbi:fibronectin type III domain-containing protein [Streptomyces sp. NBC_00996]|uniref:fibronectin type III domain-containing protein n=1 Tax=Streptomyces sp. NBC_00996 TaxID=2903710 RepID=UPI003868DAEE|nr:fibronectin type III domain-containing protein [Streptomyces sp. NBC_00996]